MVKHLSKIVLSILVICGFTLSPKVPLLNQNISKSYTQNNNIQALSNNIDINKLKNAGSEDKVESNTTNDPLFTSQYSIFQTESNKAWPLIDQKREIKVAVVDTGVDYNQPDLKNRVLLSDGYDFINNDNDPMDDNWHGTHVAGIIAAEANNNEGITGVAGNLDVKIIPVKVLDSKGVGPSDIIAEGIKYAVDKGADIINLSVGFKVKDQYITDAVDYANKHNVLVVAAAGNDNIDCDNNSPAGNSGVLAVAAVDSQNKKADFSNYGSVITVAAPGVDILSTIPGEGYDFKSGTSMAAPIVTGVAAMLKAEQPDLTPKEIIDNISKSAVDILDNGKDKFSGYGLVDAYNAVKALENSETNNNHTMYGISSINKYQ